MAYTEAGKNVGVTAIAAEVTKLRIMDADSLEITNWDSESQDQAVTWGTAASGEIEPNETPEFQVKAGDVVASVRYLGADNTVYGEDVIPVEERESFTNNGIFRAESVKLKIIDP